MHGCGLSAFGRPGRALFHAFGRCAPERRRLNAVELRHAAARRPRDPLRLCAAGQDRAAHGAPEARSQRAAAIAQARAHDQSPAGAARRSGRCLRQYAGLLQPASGARSAQGGGRKPGRHLGPGPAAKQDVLGAGARAPALPPRRGLGPGGGIRFRFSPCAAARELPGLRAAQLHARAAAAGSSARTDGAHPRRFRL